MARKPDPKIRERLAAKWCGEPFPEEVKGIVQAAPGPDTVIHCYCCGEQITQNYALVPVDTRGRVQRLFVCLEPVVCQAKIDKLWTKTKPKRSKPKLDPNADPLTQTS